LAARLARQRPEQPEFDSPELAVWPPVRGELRASLQLVAQEPRVPQRGPGRLARQVVQQRPEQQQAADGQLLRRRRALASQTLRRTRRLRQLALVLEWRCELFQQRRPVSSWSESFSPSHRSLAEGQ